MMEIEGKLMKLVAIQKSLGEITWLLDASMAIQGYVETTRLIQLLRDISRHPTWMWAAAEPLVECQSVSRHVAAFNAPSHLPVFEIAGGPHLLPDLYGSPIPASDDAEEEGLVRTNKAHDMLLRLEVRMRRFINEQMTNKFDEDWPKHRLPNGLYDDWCKKRETALQNGGQEWILINYADFTDYERVICKRDNWNIFRPFFSREESVRESFQRLYPIRLNTAHARPITEDDERILDLEIRRFMKVILRGASHES